jgi:hypothetical protein
MLFINLPIIYYLPLSLAVIILFILLKKVKRKEPIPPFRTFDISQKSDESEINYSEWVGQRVWKKGLRNPNKNSYAKKPKKFKSGFEINTVKDVIIHPQLGVPAFTFYEDDSYVACKTCSLVKQ